MDHLMPFLTSQVVEGFLSASMRLAVPILLAALGGVYNERAGVLNVGMEGMMIGGCLVGFVVAYFSENVWLGVLASVLIGVMLGLILGFFTVTLDANQIVAGIAFNLLMLGVTSFLFRLFFGINQQPRVNGFATVPIPVLSDLPFLGPLFFRQSALVYITYIFVIISFFVIFRSAWGLQIIGSGENPEATETLGIDVIHLFLDGMTAGRGYIALAILVLGRRNPFGLLAASLLFGAADALQLRTQLLDIGIPFQFMLMLPYILTILTLSVFVRRIENPSALGIHYKRGGKNI
jgi:simple sugar transport system permease protein